jgi:hypothetical protein
MKPGNVFAAPQMVQVAVVISPPSSSDIKILRIILFEVAAKSASRFFHSATMLTSLLHPLTRGRNASLAYDVLP